jgi:hypothetical protein
MAGVLIYAPYDGFGVLKPTVVPLRGPPPSIAIGISLIGFPDLRHLTLGVGIDF